MSSGIPLFRDDVERSLADPAAEVPSTNDWHPADSSTSKLWRCAIILRDVLGLLKDIPADAPIADRRRRVKMLATPLFSLYHAVRDLLNDLPINPNSRPRLSRDQVKRLEQIRDTLKRAIPADQKGALREVRDKISAHLDKKTGAYEARAILDKAEVHAIGYWLHLCLVALLELLLLEVYGWTTGSEDEGVTHLMTSEPFLLTFALVDNKPVRILRMAVSKSPKIEIGDIIREVVRRSQWMFRDGDPHVRRLIEGGEEELGFYTDALATAINLRTAPPKRDDQHADR